MQVQLAETLDIYYVDPYSLPNKQLSCGVAAKFAHVPNKRVIYRTFYLPQITNLAFTRLGLLCYDKIYGNCTAVVAATLAKGSTKRVTNC